MTLSSISIFIPSLLIVNQNDIYRQETSCQFKIKFKYSCSIIGADTDSIKQKSAQIRIGFEPSVTSENQSFSIYYHCKESMQKNIMTNNCIIVTMSKITLYGKSVFCLSAPVSP